MSMLLVAEQALHRACRQSRRTEAKAYLTINHPTVYVLRHGVPMTHFPDHVKCFRLRAVDIESAFMALEKNPLTPRTTLLAKHTCGRRENRHPAHKTGARWQSETIFQNRVLRMKAIKGYLLLIQRFPSHSRRYSTTGCAPTVDWYGVRNNRRLSLIHI